MVTDERNESRQTWSRLVPTVHHQLICFARVPLTEVPNLSFPEEYRGSGLSR